MGPSHHKAISRIATISFLLISVSTAIALENGPYVGRSLEDVLRELQAAGLNIVYSSAVIRPGLVVMVEPTTGNPRRVLDEILAPHGLIAQDAPGGSIIIVPGPAVPGTSSGATEVGAAQSGDPPQVEPMFLGEVVVTPSHFKILDENPETRQFLSRTEVEQMPHLADDLYRAVKRLPGTASGDYSARFNIRGGEPEEMLVLFDGARLYEPYHLKDFRNVFSIIDSAAVSGVDLLTGGYPVEYGDRMSGVMDISAERPPEPLKTTTVALSTINARIHSAGLFDEGRGSWMVSARAWYPGAVLKAAGGTTDDLQTDYYDLFAKVEHALGDRSTLSADLLLAYDDLGYRTVDDETNEGVDATYGSYHLWFNLQTSWTQRLYSRIVLSGGHLGRDRVGDVVDVEEGTLAIDDDRSFDFIDLRQDWTFDLNDDNLLKWGLVISNQEANYDYLRIEQAPPIGDGGEPRADPSEVSVFLEPEGWGIGAYLADRIRPLESLVVEAGLRWDHQTWIDDHQLSPRVNLLYSVNPVTTVRAAWGQFYQSQRLNELQVEDGVTEFYPAQRAEHWLASVEHRFRNGLGLRIEAYHKDLSDLRPRYENLFGEIDLFPEALPDRILITPDGGRSRGVEVVLRRNLGSGLSWWLSYALASAEDLIGDDWQPRSWDQRHAATFGLDLSLPRRWHLYLAGAWHSGWPTTEVTAELVEGPDGEVEVATILGPRNHIRYPSYHRLDMRTSKIIPTRHGDLTLFIEILNLLDTRNVCCTDDFNFEIEDDGSITVRPHYQYWPPIIPSIGARYRF